MILPKLETIKERRKLTIFYARHVEYDIVKDFDSFCQQFVLLSPKRVIKHPFVLKVIPFNCIAHPFCASFFASLARARARARSELDRFSMEAELFREINGRFLLNELGDPTFLFHLFEENTTLHDILKFEELFIIQF